MYLYYNSLIIIMLSAFFLNFLSPTADFSKKFMRPVCGLMLLVVLLSPLPSLSNNADFDFNLSRASREINIGRIHDFCVSFIGIRHRSGGYRIYNGRGWEHIGNPDFYLRAAVQHKGSGKDRHRLNIQMRSQDIYRG